MSIASELNTLATALSGVLSDCNDALAEETSLSASTLSAVPTAISSLCQLNVVRFLDYDGTVLKSARVTDGSSVTPPTNPTRTDYTFKRWNKGSACWTNVTDSVDITAEYTYSGATSTAVLNVTNLTGLSLILSFELYSGSATLQINWGDGSQSTISTTTDIAHTYASTGVYNLTFKNISGSGKWQLGETNYSFFDHGNFMLTNFQVGTDVVALSNSAFSGSICLKNISFAGALTLSTNQTISGCSSLVSIEFFGAVNASNIICQSNYKLLEFNIPEGVTTMNSNCFDNCYSLAKITIPSGVTSIGVHAFNNCYNLRNMYVYASSPPTINSIFGTSGIPSPLVIHVPNASLSAYQSAWSDYSSHIVGDL